MAYAGQNPNSQAFRPEQGRAAGVFSASAGLVAPKGTGFAPHSPAAMVRRVAPPPSPPQPDPAPATQIVPAAPAPAPEPIMPRGPILTPAREAELRAEGHAAGYAAGLAEAEARLAEAMTGAATLARALTQALADLHAPPQSVMAEFASQLDRAVAHLASERAGQAIDAHPAAFAARLALLAERVARHAHDVTIRLHPQDLALVQSVLAKDCPADLVSLAGTRLLADPALARGDADLRAPGVRLADLLEPAPPTEPAMQEAAE